MNGLTSLIILIGTPLGYTLIIIKKLQNNITNFKLSNLKAFKTKLFLNELPSYFHFRSIYPNLFPNTNCFIYNTPDSPNHWLLCSGTNNINQIILTAITNTINSTDLDLSSNTISQLIQTIYNHPAFYLSPALLSPYYIQTTLKGLIPSHLIQDLRPFYLSSKLASQIIIKILLQVSELSYKQL